MRRNTVTIIKYLVFAALFLTLGPFLVKFVIPDDHEDIAPRENMNVQGLPMDPEEVIHRQIADKVGTWEWIASVNSQWSSS